MVHGWVLAFSQRLISISILKMTTLLNLKSRSRIEEIITQPVPQPNSQWLRLQLQEFDMKSPRQLEILWRH
jgi:hypothetical protein